MRLRTTVVAIMILAVCMGAPATGHGDGVGFVDPRHDARAMDIRSTKKALVHVSTNHHRWRFTVVADLATPYWIVKVLVDSRGGPEQDVVLVASEIVGDPQCMAKRWGGPRITVRCDANIDGSTMWWSIRRRALDPDKRIRWRVLTPHPDSLAFSDPDDRAPDRGWYP